MELWLECWELLGIKGIVVGMVGKAVDGIGSRVTLGAIGRLGNIVGIFGSDGAWVFGIVGNVAYGFRNGILGRDNVAEVSYWCV